jgi:hypothetical protein
MMFSCPETNRWGGGSIEIDASLMDVKVRTVCLGAQRWRRYKARHA